MKTINSICIIDDDPITVFGVKKILGKIVEWNEMSSYADGKSAIDGLTSVFINNGKTPDIIFLDINMPIMDGWQFLEEFIKLPITKKVQINVVTSSIDPVDQKKAEDFALMTHHIITFRNKPLRIEEMKEVTKAA
ncbi:CheY-like chemotaxis protein [Saonia flava]|uniref:CheY-like chemotaxis protein n=1 Tax=Saonia flava TaxID=523696 RepID=A0A846QRH4_9FLAO|nr:response regulator [Saonia flava]NJB70698.1 CheY-like chemotaxis protein [Saonia flava]